MTERVVVEWRISENNPWLTVYADEAAQLENDVWMFGTCYVKQEPNEDGAHERIPPTRVGWP